MSRQISRFQKLHNQNLLLLRRGRCSRKRGGGGLCACAICCDASSAVGGPTRPSALIIPGSFAGRWNCTTVGYQWHVLCVQIFPGFGVLPRGRVL